MPAGEGQAAAAALAVAVVLVVGALAGGGGETGLDEVLEDGHEEEQGDEDGRRREAEGDGAGVRGRVGVPRIGLRRGVGAGHPYPRPGLRPCEPAHGLPCHSPTRGSWILLLLSIGTRKPEQGKCRHQRRLRAPYLLALLCTCEACEDISRSTSELGKA
jgi:hypothetical protein